MGKKKSGKKKSGKGKKDGGDTAADAIKLLETGYTRRCAERHGQDPIEAVVTELKKASRAEASWTQLLVTPEACDDLVGPFEGSRLDPLLDAVLGTGYKALSQVFVWNVPLRNADVMVLARYLENPKSTVGELEFMHNDLTAFAYGRLGEALSFNRAVTKLSFLHNDAGDAGCVALCKGLAFNSTVEELHLEFCGIGVGGAEALGRLLATNATLADLCLGGNHVGSGGGIHLARALAVNRSLKRLDLANNHVDVFAPGDEDACVFIEALAAHASRNGVFAYLDLSDNVIETRGGEAVLVMYEARKEAGAPSINVLVGPRMRKEVYDAIAKSTKWVAGTGKAKGGKGKKKSGKGGKKKKK